MMQVVPATPEAPYAKVLQQMSQWASAHAGKLQTVHEGAMAEIGRRIERLQTAFALLLQINTQLSGATLPEVRFDSASDEISICLPGSTEVRKLKIPRQDPNVPMELAGSSAIGFFHPGTPSRHDTTETLQLKSQLEALIEQYYYNAHRVLKLVQGLPGCRNLKCKAITIVRNKLIEHADHADIYSFGFGTHGPVVRPIGKAGGRTWTDAGLIPNTGEFVEALSVAFKA